MNYITIVPKKKAGISYAKENSEKKRKVPKNRSYIIPSFLFVFLFLFFIIVHKKF